MGMHDHGEDGFHLDPLAAQFRNGSNSEVCVRNWEVRSALNNGHRQPDLSGPKSANERTRSRGRALAGAVGRTVATAVTI